MPKVMWLPAADVARAAVAGMDADRAVVIPGLANRVGAAAGWLSPRGVLVPMVARRHPALGTLTGGPRPSPTGPPGQGGPRM